MVSKATAIFWDLHNIQALFSVFFLAPLNRECACVPSPLQLQPTLCNPMDSNPSGSSVHGIFQASILEWVAMPSSRGSSRPRDWTSSSYISWTGMQLLYLHHLESLKWKIIPDFSTCGKFKRGKMKDYNWKHFENISSAM